MEGYMEWFCLVSHPYIIQMPDHDRPTVVAPMRDADVDDGQTHDDDRQHMQHESAAMVSYLYLFNNII